MSEINERLKMSEKKVSRFRDEAEVTPVGRCEFEEHCRLVVHVCASVRDGLSVCVYACPRESL